MTYIVGGKLDDNPFLMIDCKVSNQEQGYIFEDKVVSFNSNKSEAYFCQMGCAVIKSLITMVDIILTYQNKKIDLFNHDDINWLFREINEAIKYSNLNIPSGDNLLFFISKNDICKYSVSYDIKRKEYINIVKTTIKNYECLTSNSIICRNVNTQSDKLKSYCKDIIEQEKMGLVDDLKDRFTFIYSAGDQLIYDFPFKSKNDVINMINSMGFEKLE